MEVHLVMPERELWTGEASMVIARGTEGDVGILPGHAPLMIRLAIGVIRIQHDGEETKAVVDGGFMHVTPGEDLTRVDVLADDADLEGDIDRDEAERQRADAERRLQEDQDERAQADLQSAMARLELTG
jgi:F-type H+-transporting ATPase subunit epsilon